MERELRENYSFAKFIIFLVFAHILYFIQCRVGLTTWDNPSLTLTLTRLHCSIFFHHIHILLPFIPPSFVCDFARVVFCCLLFFQHRERERRWRHRVTQKQHKRAAKVTRLMSSTAVMMVITLIKKKHQQKQREILENSLIQTEVNCEICTHLFWMLFSW